MNRVYDTGDLVLANSGAEIAQNHWSYDASTKLTEITLPNYGGKVVKVVVEATATGSPSDAYTLYLFSEANTSWAEDGAADQAPVETTGQMVKIESTTEYKVDDNGYFFANNDSSVAKKLYLAVLNTDANTSKFNVRILYESLGVTYS